MNDEKSGQVEYLAAALLPGDAPKDPAEGYELVRGLIYSQVAKFWRKFGGEFDELVGEANLAFVRGHERFITGARADGTPIEHAYATEIRRWVWYELFDAMRQRAARHTMAPFEAIGERDFAHEDASFDVAELAAGLSADAQYVVGLVVRPPAEVYRVAQGKGGEPRNFRSTVRDYLRGQEWGPARINTAFAEIKEALG